MLRQRRSIHTQIKTVLLILLAAIAISFTIVARPLFHLMQTARSDSNERVPLPLESIDDASHLNQTRMTVVKVSSNLSIAKRQLRETLQNAELHSKKVIPSGSRHTMGGHTIYRDGIALDMTQFNQMRLNPITGILTVQSGATWSTVIPYLHQHGFSVAVMQSNNDFSIGGTMSANAHGWQHDHPPFASTVESFQLMLADGRVVRCSRQENAELFSLVLGGYGLFGIVLDVNLRAVPDQLYTAQRTIVPSQAYIETYRSKVSEKTGMAYGRLSIAPENFLQEAILTVYDQVPSEQPLPLTASSDSQLARTIFRGSVGSDYGKSLRWQLEKLSGGEAGSEVSRNQILNRPSTLFENHKQAETEILHEYFIPPESLEPFLEKCRQIIPAHQADLLNVTIRNVHPDSDSFLRYADREMFGLVMLFHQARTPAEDAKMQALTQELIEAALAVGGRYYLPYRLHATPEQFDRAYPQGREFFQLKRKYDPNQLFQNQFYARYGLPQVPGLVHWKKEKRL
ncbi:MAG: FAD-binding oxidoreductase [Phormidium tanganyikae FI6-MK23]|jgi:FAD/FMN-containing dehydrogenase|nr:FAD-binding oxidoreductase [Phormidium tanganyikae FI6-MK23]